MRAELISIGTELLLGAITDTNATHIAQALQQIGLDLIFKTTVGDNEQRIAQVIDHALSRVDVAITSGGLGPTVDDVTREAVARATGRPLEFRQELLDQIADRFRRFGVEMSENNRRQAMIPTGALPIENPVGTAPIFILETERGVVLTLPGVPREMKYLLDNELLPWLRAYLKEPAVIKSVVLRTAGIGESQIDARITDLMAASNPTVGLAAHSGQTDIRVTAKAMTPEQADEMMAPVVKELEGRLGAWIYGTEKQVIEEAVLKMLAQRGSSLATLEAGSGELLAERLRTAQGAEAGIKLISTSRDNVENVPGMALDEQALSAATQMREQNGTDYGLAVLIHSPASGSESGESGTGIAVAGPAGSRKRYFGWSRERVDAPVWATTHALAMLRRMLVNAEEPAP